MSDNSTQVVKVILVSLIFCAVSVGVLIGLSTVAAKYVVTHENNEASEKPHNSTIKENETKNNIKNEIGNPAGIKDVTHTEPKPVSTPQAPINTKETPVKPNQKAPIPNSTNISK